MKKRTWASTALMLAIFVGCGGGDRPTADLPPPVNSSTNQIASASSFGGNPQAANVVVPKDPKEIVRVFLDAMRSGNGEQLAVLFTRAAREEIKRQGIQIEPPGSAQATFTIGDAQPKDDEMLVSSTWLEPAVAGQPAQSMEVVWVLHKDPEGWRVSGMAVATGPTENDLEIVNFESLEEPTQEQPAPPQGRMARLPNGPGVPSFPTNGFENPSAGYQPTDNGLPSGITPGNLPPASLPPGNLPPANFPGGATGSLPPLPGGQPSGTSGLPPANFPQ